MQFKPDHYFPIVKWKQGEQKALDQLAPNVKQRLTPIIEVIPIPTDLDSGEQTKTLEEHGAKAVDDLVKYWGTSDIFYLDCSAIIADFTEEGENGVQYVFQTVSQQGLNFIPVLGIERSNAEITAALSHSSQGVLIRLTMDEIAAEDYSAIESFVNENGLEYESTDLLIDLGFLENQRPGLIKFLSEKCLSEIPKIKRWRTVILAGTAFPESLREVPTNGTASIGRTEWLAWQSLYNSKEKLPRLPNFGDYGIQNPEGVEGFDPRYMTPAAAIRYTTSQEWLLIKGETMKNGGGQYRHLADTLINHNDYSGASHCNGCSSVLACFQGTGSAGSLGVWRRIGTCHHFTLVTEQLAQLTF